MKPVLRMIVLILALAGFLFFFSFNIENLGPKQTVTVGFNLSPWLTWSRIKGVGDFGKSVEVNFLSWSSLGLAAGIALLMLRSRIK
ncbi:MAG TPA: hypothetical protein VK846_18325 [Candidatus Limnocylindria bacterium]|nr:hypothetical protein [Candidatus Limnocylindria bacterium]